MDVLLIVHEGEHFTVTAPWCVAMEYILVLALVTLSWKFYFIIIYFTYWLLQIFGNFSGPRVQDKHCNLKQGLQWSMHLNWFYMAICAVSPLLARLDSENGSIIDLLGQISCAIFVPSVASLLLNRMYNDITKDLQSNEIGTNQQQLEEEGCSEWVYSNPTVLPHSYKKTV